LFAHAREHSSQLLGERFHLGLETLALRDLDFAASVFFCVEPGVKLGLGRTVEAEIMHMARPHFGKPGFELGWRWLTVDKM
jgi:hypothetical protein